MSVQHASRPQPPNGTSLNGKAKPLTIHTEPEPVVESAPLRNAPPSGRPYWLQRPCPRWCEDTSQHREGDHPDDRIHFSLSHTIWLSTEDPTVETHGTRSADGCPDPDSWQVWPAEVRLWLRQDYREAEPRIGFGADDSKDVHLTIAEAAELRDLLSQLITEAR